MSTKRTNNLWIIFISLLLFSFPFFAMAQGSPKLYPRPVKELEEVIYKWFSNSGFQVSRASQEGSGIRFKAEREKETWHISLDYHSPLATEIHAGYFVDGVSVDIRVKELWGFLSRYIKGHSVEKDSSNPLIPTPVLTKIESVVCIRAKLKERSIQFSGFIVDREGLILCTAHDLKDVRELTVILYDGRELKGYLDKIDFTKDMALVHVNSRFSGFISLDMGRNLLGMGETLYSIGCPLNLGGTIYSGMINGPPRRINDLLLWQINMEIHPGSSGSPVFDVEGNLVAMVMGRHRGTDSVGFLVPFEIIMEFVREE